MNKKYIDIIYIKRGIEVELVKLYDKVMADKRFNHHGPSMMQRKEEVIWLLEVIGKSSLDEVIEFGSMAGGNLVMLSELVRDGGTVLSIEPELEMSLKVDIVMEYIGNKCLVHHKVYTTDSNIIEILGDRPSNNLVMIDALHETRAVLSDFDLAVKIIDREDTWHGYIAIHDIVKPKVAVAWRKIKEIMPSTLEFICEESLRYGADSDRWGGIGIVKL